MSEIIIQKELKRISKEHGGILKPEDVVAVAQDECSPLHCCFEWDNVKAGHEHRLWQARQLIRVCVEVKGEERPPVRMFVSLSTDRKNSGYRRLDDVMDNSFLKKILLEDAYREMNYFIKKYQTLQELGGVIREMGSVLDKQGEKAKA